MALNDMHLLFQQMGEVLTGIRGLHDTIDLRQAQAHQLHDLLRSDIANLRQDQRALEEKFECIVYILQGEMEAVRTSTADNARSLQDVMGAVHALRHPVAEILSLKSRLAWLLFGAGMVGSAVLWLAVPVYGWLVNATLGRR